MAHATWRIQALVASSLLGVAGIAFSPADDIAAGAAATDRPARAVPAEDRARGLVWTGLTPGRANGPCAGLFEITTSRGISCTHGPDPAPIGVDVTAPLADTATDGTAATATSSVHCEGDGVGGNRVQAIYAHAVDTPDRFDAVQATLRAAAANVDATFAASAAKTGGERYVRWVTDQACNLTIERVQLSASGDDNVTNTQSELESLGFARTDRKFLVWVDMPINVYCGIGDIRYDDQAALTNANNRGPSYVRVDTPCWNLQVSAEAHELMHALGGVQMSAPHTTFGWHCTDGSDPMCYPDSPSVTMTYPCGYDQRTLFDCNNDDYFSTNPPAGSYLGTHWNTANSSFLVDPNPTAPPPPPTTTTTSTSTTSTSTTSTTVVSTTATATYSGSLSRKQPTKSYGLTTAAGSMAVSVSFSKAPTMTVTVTGADGTVLAQTTGPSKRTLVVPVAAGSKQVSVSSGGATASYTATVSYPT